MANETTSATLMTPEALLQHWQGHRKLTRRVIEAFPEDKLFTFSLGGMRTFGELANEMIGMGVPIVDGIATGKWEHFQDAKPTTKAEQLALWDVQTEKLNAKYATIPLHRFNEVDKAFGQWEMSGLNGILYAIDNEIHHRGQGTVYLRSLGIEPPAFWDRS